LSEDLRPKKHSRVSSELIVSVVFLALVAIICTTMALHGIQQSDDMAFPAFPYLPRTPKIYAFDLPASIRQGL